MTKWEISEPILSDLIQSMAHAETLIGTPKAGEQ